MLRVGLRTAEVPHGDLVAAEGEEGLVLVEEDEGGGGHEARLGHVDDRRALHVDDLQRLALLLDEQLLAELLDELDLLRAVEQVVEPE